VALQALQRRERIGQVRDDQLRNSLWFEQIAQSVLAEIAHRRSEWELFGDCGADDVREQDLSAPAGIEKTRKPVEA
jgi:hypothetical protein